MSHVLAHHLEAAGDLTVVGVARDRGNARHRRRTLRPDVVTIDAQMTDEQGVATIISIMAEQPTPVVIVSAGSHDAARASARGLALGAVEVIAKAELGVVGEQNRMGRELVAAVRR